MNQNTVPDYASLINHQIIIQERLLEHHLKAEAMLNLFLECTLHHHSLSTIHSYIWGLDDHVTEAKRLNEDLLRLLMKMVRLLEPPRNPPDGSTVH